MLKLIYYLCFSNVAYVLSSTTVRLLCIALPLTMHLSLSLSLSPSCFLLDIFKSLFISTQSSVEPAFFNVFVLLCAHCCCLLLFFCKGFQFVFNFRIVFIFFIWRTQLPDCLCLTVFRLCVYTVQTHAYIHTKIHL